MQTGAARSLFVRLDVTSDFCTDCTACEGTLLVSSDWAMQTILHARETTCAQLSSATSSLGLSNHPPPNSGYGSGSGLQTGATRSLFWGCGATCCFYTACEDTMFSDWVVQSIFNRCLKSRVSGYPVKNGVNVHAAATSPVTVAPTARLVRVRFLFLQTGKLNSNPAKR